MKWETFQKAAVKVTSKLKETSEKWKMREKYSFSKL